MVGCDDRIIRTNEAHEFTGDPSLYAFKLSIKAYHCRVCLTNGCAAEIEMVIELSPTGGVKVDMRTVNEEETFWASKEAGEVIHVPYRVFITAAQGFTFTSPLSNGCQSHLREHNISRRIETLGTQWLPPRHRP